MPQPVPLLDLRGARALVTGSTSGLGLAMADALARSGARTVVTSRDQSRAQNAAKQLVGDALGIAMDVRDEESVEEGVKEIWSSLGGLDMVVNNAGVGMRTVNPRFLTDPNPFWMVSPEGFRDVVETKLTGSFLVARAVVPRMLEQDGGRVVTISMSTATMTRRGFVRYGPSGAALEALAVVMAEELMSRAMMAAARRR